MKAPINFKLFLTVEIERWITQINNTAQYIGTFSQNDWTNSIDKKKINPFACDASDKFELALDVIFKDLEQQTHLHAQYSHLHGTEKTHYLLIT